MQAPTGANRKEKIKGRGPGSGKGGTSTRGMKGQTSRSGRATYIGFEGGQMPLIRRVPKRGFASKVDNEFQIININAISRFKENTVIDQAFLKEKGLIDRSGQKTKLLSEGNIKHPLHIKIHAVSKKAKEKIENAGGKIEIVSELSKTISKKDNNS